MSQPASPRLRDLVLDQVVASTADHVVWRARAPDGQLYAAKVLAPGSRVRRRLALAREAWVGASVGDGGVFPGRRLEYRAGALVQPWLPGGSLAELLLSIGPVGPRSACALGVGIGRSLSTLHDRGWAHGDLRLTTVVLDGDAAPVIVDLGRAVRLRRRPAAAAADTAALARLVRLLAVGTEPEDLPDPLDRLLRIPASAATLTDGLRRVQSAPALRSARPGPVELGSRATTTDWTTRSNCRPEGVRRGRAGPGSQARRRWTGGLLSTLGLAALTVGALVAAATQLRSDPAETRCMRPAGLSVDLDRDGCAESVRWISSRGEMTVDGHPPSTWFLGRPGDQLVLGDWDCDGLVTPGLHRPSTGESFRFDDWPSDRAITAVADPLDAPSCG